MELREPENGQVMLREPIADSEQYVMRAWVDEEFASRSEPVLVEFNVFHMNPDDPDAEYLAQPVVRWRGALIAPPAVADAEAFWLRDPETLRDDMERLARSYERFVRESLQEACTFVAHVMGDAEEGED